MSPIFVFPSVLVSVVMGWIGQIYMKAQLAVKRERSNARSPVLGHFGAAISGLGTSCRTTMVINTYDVQCPSVRMERRQRLDASLSCASTVTHERQLTSGT